VLNVVGLRGQESRVVADVIRLAEAQSAPETPKVIHTAERALRDSTRAEFARALAEVARPATHPTIGRRHERRHRASLPTAPAVRGRCHHRAPNSCATQR
jgi:hypothetical protein